MKSDFLASGNNSLAFSQLTGRYFSLNRFFCWKQHFFIPRLFLLLEIIIETWGNRWTIFRLVDTSFFYFCIGFLKWKQFFRIVDTYILTSFIRLVWTFFLPGAKSIFLVKAILLLIETIIFKERAYSC